MINLSRISPMVVLCTTCKGRTQHLEQTLPQNMVDNAGWNCRFVILDYNSKDHLDAYLKTRHRADIDSGKLTVYRYSSPGAFRMAHAKNMAHRLGILEGADILVNLDADNFTGRGFSDYVLEQFNTHGDNALLWAKWNDKGIDPAQRIPKGCSGRIAVTRDAFLKAGGYDEAFETWGPDDKDFHFRLRRLGYSPVIIENQYLKAILHTDKMRFREYPHARTAWQAAYENSGGFAIDGQAYPIANAGKVGMGVVYRNYSHDPIEVGLIPTRIFGIGMHKTATTSLHRALKILGLSSAHWESVRWAKTVWEEVNHSGTSETLERHYAISDLPVTMLYRRLHKNYRGAKFILTVRNEHKWLRSVEAHWTSSNQFRDTWSKEGGFPHKLHEVLYGQREFNAEVFLRRYRQHNDEVKQYFKQNGPNDLLVMDMDAGAGWLELCGFLRMTMPPRDVEYPVENPLESNTTQQ